MLLGSLFPLLYEMYTSPSHLLMRNPHGLVAVRYIICLRRCNILGLVHFHFPIIFGLYCGQEVTPIFMRQGKIVLLVILQLVLHV